MARETQDPMAAPSADECPVAARVAESGILMAAPGSLRIERGHGEGAAPTCQVWETDNTKKRFITQTVYVVDTGRVTRLG